MKISVLFILGITFLPAAFSHSQVKRTAIVNTNYVDVLQGKVKQATITMADGKIEKIGKPSDVPADAVQIDGSGKWVIPGLVDAHIHLFQSGGIYTRPDAINLTKYRDYNTEREWLKENAGDLLKRYLRCGITTLIDVGGPLYNFEIREKHKDKTQYPNLYLTGPLVSTYQPDAFKIEDAPIIKVASKEEAVELVKKQLPYKPDFIKIWYITSRAGQTLPAETNYEIVKATIDESHKNGLKVAVHATEVNTAKIAIKAGADILVHSVSDPVDEEFISMLLQKKIPYIPTLMVHAKYVETYAQTIKPSKEDLAFSNPIPLGSLSDPIHLDHDEKIKDYKTNAPERQKKMIVQDSIREANLNTLNKRGVIISTGTDAGNIGTQHASSYYEEIYRMKKSGLSNADILKASTLNGAIALGKEKEFGSIEAGKTADLVILNANPLEKIDAIKDVQYVVKGGNVFRADTLIRETPEHLVQQQVNAYNARDIDAFLEPYSEDVEIYNFPNELVSKGKDKMKPRYASMFEKLTNLHCEVVNRSIMGNTVIDQEKVRGFPNKDFVHAIAIYKIENGKIAKVYFIK